jgi:uncharacterized membrane protein
MKASAGVEDQRIDIHRNGGWTGQTGEAGVRDCFNDSLTARRAVTLDNGTPLAFTRPEPCVWLLRRNCSLSPRQSLFATGLLAGFSIVVAVLLAMAGVWVVLPYTLVEVIAVGSCFLLYARHAPDYERIELTDETLTVVQCCGPSVRRFELNPLWVSVRLGDGRNPTIHINYAGKATALGRHVTLAQRRRVVSEINVQLRSRYRGKR